LSRAPRPRTPSASKAPVGQLLDAGNRDRDRDLAAVKEGPIVPSVETVRGGTYRPLSRPLFIYVSATALARAEGQKFVEYYITQASELIEEVGYVPLSSAEQQLVRDRFASKTTGTMYGSTSTLSAHASLEERLKPK
jgi:phosphate transport system substrate-binding protein